MMDNPAQVEIPNRALFKAAEVCDLAKVQPYVLRSWETEFPDFGVTKGGGAPRVYRRADVQRVFRIKHLLLVEGLTLAGARRRISEESIPADADAPDIDELIGQNARERLAAVKRGLRSILELLAGSGRGDDFKLAPPVAEPPRSRAVPTERAKPSRGKESRARRPAARSPQARRNRSA